MSQWIIKGLRTGIRTTAYPKKADASAGITPGRPVGGAVSRDGLTTLVSCCPTGALGEQEGAVAVDYRRCVHCYRCLRDVAEPLAWSQSYEWAGARDGASLAPAFARSIQIMVVDAGDCGACLNEVRQLNNPYYNLHRLGFFITPTPRHADVLLVVGPATDHMRHALRKVYDAMPAPKSVIAVGACALSGGVFGPSFLCGAGVGDVLPVDVEVPGHPPPPLAILHGLLVAVGRKASVPLTSPRPVPGTQ
jgi:Ni,Fe-hydrogenase III small subunit